VSDVLNKAWGICQVFAFAIAQGESRKYSRYFEVAL
jgi:hypothetical protein